MPIAVGIDLVSEETVGDAIREHADRYLRRVYTQRELEDSRTQDGYSPRRLAVRFAAKEATIKVLRPSVEAALPLHEIEVRSLQAERLQLTLYGHVATLAEQAGLESLALSITFRQGVALAIVMGRVSGSGMEAMED